MTEQEVRELSPEEMAAITRPTVDPVTGGVAVSPWPACPNRDDSCGCGARGCSCSTNGPRFGTPVAVNVPGVAEGTAYKVTPGDCQRCVTGR